MDVSVCGCGVLAMHVMMKAFFHKDTSLEPEEEERKERARGRKENNETQKPPLLGRLMSDCAACIRGL